jgi:Putative beta-barrel porin-2, OmpL-like. bbp2/Carboxypeptidase regulatory-like domain
MTARSTELALGFASHILLRCLKERLLSVLAAALLLPVAHAAAPSPGTIVGIITNSAQVPVAHATVTAIKVGGGIRATVSGSDGVYSFADLPPGTWSITSSAEGYADTVVAQLDVVPNLATRRDIVMAGGPPVAVAAAPAPAATPAPTATPAAPAQVVQAVPEALQAPEPGPADDKITPWADVGYIGWMNGTSRESSPIFDTKFFTPEIRFDVNYLYSFNHPKDHTIDGSTEEFRSGEFQIEQVSFGGDFHWKNVRARFLSMFGLFSVTTPRNDASQAVGQWDLQGAYKYFSEANAGYHWDVAHGLNVDLGIFVSYIGLFSYYNFDNWTYQPSFVSSNTPWFFNGMRVQFWPTQNLKIEPWLINGWQSYAKFNSHPGFGGQVLWIPNDSLKLVFNSYFLGQDNLSNQFTNGVPLNAGSNGSQNVQIATTSLPGTPYVDWSKVQRIHEDDSVLVKYYDAHGQNGNAISRMAFSLTADVGCEYGGGVGCAGGPNKENFFGMMFYNRVWWSNNIYALTIGGGFYNNPGRYLALTPPINGATAATGTAYFSQEPGLKLYQWDTQINFQYMPKDWITWWTEATFRHSSVPYWTGPGGITAPGALPGGAGATSGNVNGVPGGLVCNDGTTATTPKCTNDGGLWEPDLRTREIVFGAGVLLKF